MVASFSAIITSPSIANEAETPPVVGSVRTEIKGKFNFPNAFKIRFNFKGVENQNLPKFKECYLRTMSHTINPTGGGFKVDGKPNEIDLTLSFVENQTLDKDDIKAGF